jgi:hypothetical protein
VSASAPFTRKPASGNATASHTNEVNVISPSAG